MGQRINQWRADLQCTTGLAHIGYADDNTQVSSWWPRDRRRNDRAVALSARDQARRPLRQFEQRLVIEGGTDDVAPGGVA